MHCRLVETPGEWGQGLFNISDVRLCHATEYGKRRKRPLSVENGHMATGAVLRWGREALAPSPSSLNNMPHPNILTCRDVGRGIAKWHFFVRWWWICCTISCRIVVSSSVGSAVGLQHVRSRCPCSGVRHERTRERADATTYFLLRATLSTTHDVPCSFRHDGILCVRRSIASVAPTTPTRFSQIKFR